MLCFNSEGEPVSNALLHPHFSLHPGISVFQPSIVRAQCHAAGVPCWSSNRTFSNLDNTAGILTGRATYSRLHKSVYLVPVVITDDDYPMQSSTGTLTVRVCTCDHEGNMELCKPEALSSSPGLSTGALTAILLCAIILLCKYDWICKQMYILYLYIIVVPYHTILVLPQSGGLRNFQWLCLQEQTQFFSPETPFTVLKRKLIMIRRCCCKVNIVQRQTTRGHYLCLD